MTDPVTDIEMLMMHCEALRAAQRNYFTNRTEVDKKLSIAKEDHLDAFLKQLRRKGYSPDHIARIEQNKMF